MIKRYDIEKILLIYAANKMHSVFIKQVKHSILIMHITERKSLDRP